MGHTLATILMVASLPGVRAATSEPIDPERSTITVHVGKSGVFRAFADDHTIRGAMQQGFVDEAARGVEIVVDARRLRVLDPKLSSKDRDEVQARMLGAEVLDVNRFPEIRFTSHVAETTEQGWTVRGELTLHGQTRAVTATVTRQEAHYKGSARVKQTEFGITPITVAGGTVKVKDEVEIEFDVVTRTR
jgi:polyisoprenoid-binding protein YceI